MFKQCISKDVNNFREQKMGSELVVNMEANQVILAPPPNNDLDNKSALSEKGIIIRYQSSVRESYNDIFSPSFVR